MLKAILRVLAPMSLLACADQPNIILILADDLGYGDVGAYGATLIETPNIDLLAHEGMRLTDAHAPNAECAPPRYSILTASIFYAGKGHLGWATAAP